MATAYILDTVRTPRGRGKIGKGALAGLHPQELLAQTLNQLGERTHFQKQDVDDVVIGCVSQAGEQGANLARNALIHAEWPQEVSGVTLNRFCGSGAQAVNFAAMGVLSGQQQLVVAGGVESMSHCPIGSDGAGIDGNHENLRRKVFQVPQGISADLIATLEGFTREQLDEVALRSQQNAARAIEEGRFKRSLFGVKDPATGKVLLDREEYPRPDTSAAGLAQLKPAFVEMGAMQVGFEGETFDQIALKRYPQLKAIQHLHTAGNSSGVVDGAAAVLLASEAYVKKAGLKPRARLRALATIGAEPVIMLTAPTPAAKKALALAGMKPSDIDLWEINEAFASVVLQTMKNLDLSPDRVNVNGGGIALGHPLGATGAMLIGTAIDELERRNLTTALITMCIGGGQGIATILERI